MNVTEEIKQLIDKVVRDQFAGITIESVRVAEVPDYNDEIVFKVTVVFDHKGGLDAKKTSGIVRHIRHKLLERNDNTFPIMSFVSKADAASIKPEAA